VFAGENGAPRQLRNAEDRQSFPFWSGFHRKLGVRKADRQNENATGSQKLSSTIDRSSAQLVREAVDDLLKKYSSNGMGVEG
jgi:hypothetical protein